MDICAVTDIGQWRLQSTDNKQGSSGFLEEWPDCCKPGSTDCLAGSGPIPTRELPDGSRLYGDSMSPGEYLTSREKDLHTLAREVYDERLKFGVAKEQARKDLPLSNYTLAYWKCDLKNLLHFLSLRMDSHAQLEIRQFANAIYDIIKRICPIAVEAFDEYDFRRGGLMLSGLDVKVIQCLYGFTPPVTRDEFLNAVTWAKVGWPGITDTTKKNREQEECWEKLKRMELAKDEDCSTAGVTGTDCTSTGDCASAQEQPPVEGGADAQADQGNREVSTSA
jgi:thymidylate synthase ThyX